MPRTPVVIIADRSQLAANLYRLLIAPMGAALLMRRSCQDVIDHLRRGAKVDLAIVSTNAVGRRPDEMVDRLESEVRARCARKLFLCRETKADERLRGKLAMLSNSEVMTRPFDPKELAAKIARRISRKR